MRVELLSLVRVEPRLWKKAAGGTHILPTNAPGTALRSEAAIELTLSLVMHSITTTGLQLPADAVCCFSVASSKKPTIASTTEAPLRLRRSETQ